MRDDILLDRFDAAESTSSSLSEVELSVDKDDSVEDVARTSPVDLRSDFTLFGLRSSGQDCVMLAEKTTHRETKFQKSTRILCSGLRYLTEFML